MAVLVQRSADQTVANIPALYALTRVTEGMTVMVQDAIGDVNAGEGWAIYRWSAPAGAWALVVKENKDTMSLTTESKVISGDHVLASNVPANGVIWNVFVQTNPNDLSQIVEVQTNVTGGDIALIPDTPGQFDGMRLCYTYAYGTVTQQLQSVLDLKANATDVAALTARVTAVEGDSPATALHPGANVSLLTNDAGYQTASQVTTIAQAQIAQAPGVLPVIAQIKAELASDESAAAALLTAVGTKANADLSNVPATAIAAVLGYTPATTTQFASYSNTTQILALVNTQIAPLATTTQVAGLASTTQVAALSISSTQLATLVTTTQFSALTTTQILGLSSAPLSTTQTANLTTTQVAALMTKVPAGGLSSSQIGGLSSAPLSSTQIANLTTDSFAALTSTQLAALASNILPVAALKGVLTSTQVGVLGTSQIAGLVSVPLSSTQIAALNSTTLSSLPSGSIPSVAISGGGAGAANPGWNHVVNALRLQASVSPYALLCGGAADAFNDQTGVGTLTGLSYDATNHWFINQVPGDSLWGSTTALIRGGASNAVVDLSTSAMTFTSSGVTTVAGSKQDTYSLSFSGSGSYLTATNPGTATQFSGDFTVQFWVKPTLPASGAQVYLFCTTATDNTGASINMMLINKSGTQYIDFNYAGTDVEVANPMTSGAWSYVEWSRVSGTHKASINGVQVASWANATNFSEGKLTLGADRNGTSYYNPFTGLIEGFRITKAGRDVAPFTPPTAPFLTGLPISSSSGSILSIPFGAVSTPSTVNMLLRYQDVNSVGIALNTDVVLKISRDGGTTWATAAMTDGGAYDSSSRMAVAVVDVSGQPAGTSLKYQIVLATTKSLSFRGIGILWS